MEFVKNKKYIYIGISICIILICVVVCLIIDKKSKADNGGSFIVESADTDVKNTLNEVDNEKILVHITGEVNCPGVIEITEGSRIKDVVDKAGGFTNEANQDKVNLAYEVKDEQKIVIPNVNDKNEDISIIDENTDFIEQGEKSNVLVNINTATQSELESLTGIGPSMASKIVDYRNKNGKFKNKDDIKNVPGIGSLKYEVIKDEITTK